jgi:hypothetical protein
MIIVSFFGSSAIAFNQQLTSVIFFVCLGFYFCNMNTVFNIDSNLVQKYNLPVPRYTSYPTVPFWNDVIDVSAWEEIVAERFEVENDVNGISIYIHLPFCESLCTYCGCNKKITTIIALRRHTLLRWRKSGICTKA